MAQDEDSFVKADEEVRKTSEDVAPNSGTTTGRQRKKRKWDQPAESLVSAGLVIPGAQHYAVPGITGSAASVSGFVPAVTIPTSFVSTPHLQPSAVQHTAVAIVQKINQDLATKGLLAQPKIQDEVIAREIVINDADPTVRYKLTKRQTQEEIQAKTGAVVITRGKYRPPNGPIENEKPLYLHISSGAHLKDLAERIRAVDLAALMVEEIMKQGRLMPATSNVHSLVGQGTTPCSISVFVGVEADPTFNLVGRIRGPNDQYINHIMNETGATVILRGRGSGSCEGANDEEAQQPLHLFISSDNVKNLESAKALADSLLETVRSEYFASRSLPYQVASTIPTADLVAPTPLYQAASYSPSTPYAGLYPQAVVSYSHIPPNTFSPTSSIPQRPSINSNPVVSTGSFNSATKAYNAVPPPLHLLSETTVGRTETQKTDSVSKDLNPQGFTSSSTLFPCQPAPISSTLQNINDSKSVASVVASEIPITHHSKAGTNYSGYGGIYPQATPLQQVALALQRPPPPVSIQPASANGQPTKAHLCHSNGQSDKHPEKRRKFQELPVASKDHPKEVQNGSQGTDYKSAEALEKVATNQFKSSGSHVFESSSSRSMSSVDAKLMPPPPAKTASTLPLETTLMPPPKTTLMPPPKTALMQPPKTPIMPSPRTVTLPLPTSTLDASLKAMSPKETEQFSELGLKDSASKVEAGIRLVEYGEDDEDSDNDG